MNVGSGGELLEVHCFKYFVSCMTANEESDVMSKKLLGLRNTILVWR